MTKYQATSRRSNQSMAKRREQERKRRQSQQNRIIAIVGGVLAVGVVIFIVFQLVGARGGDSSALGGERPLAEVPLAERNDFYESYPEMVIDTAKNYEAVIQTAKGEMRLRLFDDEAPLAVNNFVFLATQGFYDGTTFHRVMPDFMAQGGDPSGTGSGGPGYAFEDETDNGLTFDRRGLLAMANSGPATNGSQFFITFNETPWLDGGHTIFGELIEGDETLSAISLRDPAAATAPGDVIEGIEIIETEG
jgi:cyclophilin family peptidyl-prolyl cis-trans isomerase